MPWFRCFIRGENFHGLVDDPDTPVGFYTTQFIEARDPAEAELLGLEDLKQHEGLASLRNHPLAKRARVYFEEIDEVRPDAVPAKPSGLVFFAMEGGPEPW